jgi:hypothetical protein
MNANVAEAPTNGVRTDSALEQKTHALHIKNLPYEVWCLARHNANLSGMYFRDYVVRLLAESHPFPRRSDPPMTR